MPARVLPFPPRPRPEPRLAVQVVVGPMALPTEVLTPGGALQATIIFTGPRATDWRLIVARGLAADLARP